MGASQFVGRVGGLAVALGVGVAVFSGAGVASADRGTASDTRGAGKDSSQASTPSRGRTGRAPSAAASTSQANASRPAAPAAAQTKNSRPAPAAAAHNEPISLPAAAVVADPEPVVEPAVVDEPAAGGSDPVAVVEKATPDAGPGPVDSGPVAPTVIADPVGDEPEAAVPGEVSDVVVSATGGPSDGAGSDPVGPAGSALADLLLASFIRRETVGASATGAPTASATTAALEFNPQTVYFDGVLQGNLNVTSASGCGELGSHCTLEFKVVDSSPGCKDSDCKVGKVKFNSVPDGLPGGGSGSYTFLPYATWIDPDNPTQHPTPTGTQDFTVRVSENTKFDQDITKIPLIGLIAEPIIKLLQQTPFIGDLLAPLIGASAEVVVPVNVGQLVTAGKQVAYTYCVESFDGVMISMNYFPASQSSLVLPGQYQATIFNGPGLGNPGTTLPYPEPSDFGAAPPLSWMRGQGLPDGEGLPAPFDEVPLGFNVITWDPRGEWGSQGILQMDNPFYEGRDVSALIDWALANTPLLTEDVLADPLDPNSDVYATGVPSIAMLGGSYGGAIQMTTVDPRIKSIVPSITWNSLNEALYPDDVFKTAWVNLLVAALVVPGFTPGEQGPASSPTRINSQITQLLITGNLFGFISESGHAALASSGPTKLLSKLNAPVMFNQSTADALFTLQRAVENAQTLLEQNPYLNGTIDPDAQTYPVGVAPKMVWFCGGHGVCTTQTEDQQKQQMRAMFLGNMIWANQYTKEYLKDYPIDPPIVVPGLGEVDNTGILLPLIQDSLIKPFQWWDQNGTALASDYFSWTSDFQDGTPVVATNADGGRINSFTSRTGPLTKEDPAAEIGCAITASACEWPLSNVFATEARNAVNVDITVPGDLGAARYVVGAPLVSFTYKGSGNAKAVYAQIVDNATGQVLGNLNTAIPITLDGREHTIEEFPIANIAYTAPVGEGSLTLQLVANSSLYANHAVIWSVDISDIFVELPTTTTAGPNPIVALVP